MIALVPVGRYCTTGFVGSMIDVMKPAASKFYHLITNTGTYLIARFDDTRQRRLPVQQLRDPFSLEAHAIIFANCTNHSRGHQSVIEA